MMEADWEVMTIFQVISSLSLMTFLKIVSQRISHDDDDDGTQMMSSPHDVTMVSLRLGRTRMR